MCVEHYLSKGALPNLHYPPWQPELSFAFYDFIAFLCMSPLWNSCICFFFFFFYPFWSTLFNIYSTLTILVHISSSELDAKLIEDRNHVLFIFVSLKDPRLCLARNQHSIKVEWMNSDKSRFAVGCLWIENNSMLLCLKWETLKC